MRISDWSSDVCSSDLLEAPRVTQPVDHQQRAFIGQMPIVELRRRARSRLRHAAPRVAHRLEHRDVAHIASRCTDRGLHRVVDPLHRSEEHTSELQSLMSISYAVFCLKKKKRKYNISI